MSLSVFDLFKIGLGPSSSHTVGPMVAARRFTERLDAAGLLGATTRLRVTLHGSLALTGRGHGSDGAVLLGLVGETPEGVDVDGVPARLAAMRAERCIGLLGGRHAIAFDESQDLCWAGERPLPHHPNGLRFEAFAADGRLLAQWAAYSVGGGFVVDEAEAAARDAAAFDAPPAGPALPRIWRDAAELLACCAAHGGGMAAQQRANERAWLRQSPEATRWARAEDAALDAEIDQRLLRLWNAMAACVARGLKREGELPGGFRVPRRAARLLRALDPQAAAALQIRPEGEASQPPAPPASWTRADDPLQVLDWVNLWALAVNEENAAGGRVVTAPTNGAAGIVPAVGHYLARFVPHADDAARRRALIDYLLTAGAIGGLYKRNASISGAEVGCQGEVGVACSMAAAGLCAALGGTPEQVENAAEIGMEHHLGLTCDPVGGLVQIPCIERNAIASVKALNAARMALRGDGRHHVSLDQVIRTMRETGADMQTRYKETSLGGLAVHIVAC